MLPKFNRLKKKKDFDVLFKKGKSARNVFLIFRAMHNNLEMSRFGFIVSKKVSPKAVVRNKIRRRLSVAVEKDIKNIKKGFDGAFIALPGIKNKEFLEIKDSVSELLEKSKIISKE